MLHRWLAYARKVCDLSSVIEHIRDGRIKPRISTLRIIRSNLIMFLTRMGSLNALEQTSPSRFWRRWIQGELPSADSLGRIMDAVDADSLRQAHQALYVQLKRNKALPPTTNGLMALVLDGHESHATYRRCCPGCLERPIETKRGWRTQYYHRQVHAMLLGGYFPIWLDAEPLGPEDSELTAARRLLARILRNYPRAFDIILGDALYTDAKIFSSLRKHGKDIITVLKANQPELYQDAQTLLEEAPAVEIQGNRITYDLRDLGGFQVWPQLERPLRVIRSRECRHVCFQLDGNSEDRLSQWFWVTTCSPHRATTQTLVRLGHARWDIENQGFNEVVNRWHADHVYRHAPNAILTFWLLAMLAFNLFQVFYYRNLKPQARRATSCLHVARCMASEIYATLPSPQLPEPRPP